MFIKILDELIKQHGTTRAQLSKELKFANGSIHNWEIRKTIPSGDILIKIADYFGVSVDYLLGRTPESLPCVKGGGPLAVEGLSKSAVDDVAIFQNNSSSVDDVAPLSPKKPRSGDNEYIGDPDLSELIRIYNSLSERGKGKLLGYAAAISETVTHEKKADTPDILQSVPAGKGI